MDFLLTGRQPQNSSHSIMCPHSSRNLKTKVCPLNFTLNVLFHRGQPLIHKKNALDPCPLLYMLSCTPY